MRSLMLNVTKLGFNQQSEVAMRSYNIVCPSCQGKGWIDVPEKLSNVTQIQCPACKGSTVVVVHETSNGINTYSQRHDVGQFYRE